MQGFLSQYTIFISIISTDYISRTEAYIITIILTLLNVRIDRECIRQDSYELRQKDLRGTGYVIYNETIIGNFLLDFGVKKFFTFF